MLLGLASGLRIVGSTVWWGVIIEIPDRKNVSSWDESRRQLVPIGLAYGLGMVLVAIDCTLAVRNWWARKVHAAGSRTSSGRGSTAEK